MGYLYLVRHGETEWNKQSRVQGQTDTALSDTGIRQAHALAERLRTTDIDVIYSSGLKRAKITAEIIAAHKKYPVNEKTDCREINFGPWEGLTIHEIKAKYHEHYKIYREDPKSFSLPGAETFSSVADRTYAAIMDVVRQHRGQNILLVSHSTALKAAIMRILDIDLHNYTKFRIDNASLTTLFFHEDDPKKAVVISMNDTCHLNGLSF